jgi:hypothetical protein
VVVFRHMVAMKTGDVGLGDQYQPFLVLLGEADISTPFQMVENAELHNGITPRWCLFWPMAGALAGPDASRKSRLFCGPAYPKVSVAGSLRARHIPVNFLAKLLT